MKMLKTIFMSFILLALLGLPSRAQSIDEFVTAVNQKWIERDYPSILTLIDARLSANSSDILALGLKFEYYGMAVVDLEQAQQAAVAFLTAVETLAPNEIQNPEYLVQYAIAIRDISPPDNYVDTPRTQDQADHVHKTFNLKFPKIDLYRNYASWLQQREKVSGLNIKHDGTDD